MAAPDETLVFRSAGTLWVDPGDKGPPDYDGATQLGICHEVRLTPVTRQFNITAEEYGSSVVDALHISRDWICTCLVRGWDDDTLDVVFPNVSTGGTSGKAFITEPGGVNRGTLLSDRAVGLLFAPFNTNHKGFYAVQAIPNIQNSTRLDFSVSKDLSFVATFRIIVPFNSTAFQIGQVEDMTI